MGAVCPRMEGASMSAKPSVLVTGATGFIGRDLIPRLLAHGYRVRAACRMPGMLAPRAGLEAALMPDLSGARDFAPLLDGMTCVVHLAGIAHATREISEARYMAVNAEASARLAEASRWAGVEAFLLMSSIRAQTGVTSPDPLSERDIPRPTDAYGRSKLAAERATNDALSGSRTRHVALRPVLVHGPGAKGNLRALYRLARMPMPLPLAGLTNRRSLVSLANLGGAVMHVLEWGEGVQGTYIVADGPPVSVAEIVSAMRAGLGRPAHLFKLPLAPVSAVFRGVGQGELWDRLAGDLVAEPDRLMSTGWRPSETTAEGLAAMARAEIAGADARA